MADSAPTMAVKVHAPYHTYFEDQAASVSAVNDTGPFDILPKHKNFITLLNKCDLIVRAPHRQDFDLPIERGVMHVKSDKVTVFLDV